jgi:hypothetical protein
MTLEQTQLSFATLCLATLCLKLWFVRVEVLDEQATTESLIGSLPEFIGCATRRDSNILTSRFVFELLLTLAFAQHASDANTEKPPKSSAKSQARHEGDHSRLVPCKRRTRKKKSSATSAHIPKPLHYCM